MTKKRVIPENVQRAIYFNDKVALREFQRKSVESRKKNKKKREAQEMYYFQHLYNTTYQLQFYVEKTALERHDDLIRDL